MKSRRLFLTMGFLVVLMMNSQSFATSILTDWGLTGQVYTNGSFGNWTTTSPATETGNTNGIHWAEGNNTIPSNPVLSGVAGGEGCDIEFLAWRRQGGQFQILGITSVNPISGVSGFRMGDVFIDVNGAHPNPTGYNGYDFALSNGTYTTEVGYDHLHPSDGFYTHAAGVGLYQINGSSDVHGISSNQGYGDNPTIDALADPFSIRGAGDLVAGATRIIEQIQDDNGVHNWAIEWLIDQATFEALLPTINGLPSYADLVLHWTDECGNDWLNTAPSGEQEPVVPEPATLSLLGVGLATLGLIRRRGRRG